MPLQRFQFEKEGLAFVSEFSRGEKMEGSERLRLSKALTRGLTGEAVDQVQNFGAVLKV